MSLNAYLLLSEGDGKQCIVIGSDTKEEMEVLVDRLAKVRQKPIKELGIKLQLELSEENGKE